MQPALIRKCKETASHLSDQTTDELQDRNGLWGEQATWCKQERPHHNFRRKRVEIVNDVAEEIATRRRKIGKVDLQTETDGISCHLHVSCAKLASVDAVIQHVTNVVAAKQKQGKKCEFCEARFDNLKKTRIQIVRHMAKHFNEAEFLCDHELRSEVPFTRGPSKAHQNSHSNDVELHVCELCDPSVSLKRNT